MSNTIEIFQIDQCDWYSIAMEIKRILPYCQLLRQLHMKIDWNQFVLKVSFAYNAYNEQI